MPDHQAVSGDEIKKAYLEGNYPIADLVEVEALRFLYLNGIDNKQIKKRLSSQKLQLLVLGEYSALIPHYK